MKYLWILFFSLSSFFSHAQEQSMQETARSFMRQGDFDNAILVLNRALQAEPSNLDLQKDLTMAHYYKRDHVKVADCFFKNVV